MLALANSQGHYHHPHHHHASSRIQERRAKEEKNMRNINNLSHRPHSSSSTSGSSVPSPRPHSAPRRQRPHTSRRATVVETDVAPAAPVAISPSQSASGPSHSLSTEREYTPPALTASQTTTPPPSPPQLDIANYPSADLLKLLAALLQQIASANDALRDSTSTATATPTKTSASQGGVAPRDSSSVGSPSLFHARNIPTISIESYLLRILKYCPTTNEVFLSLLVYFDRMSRASADPNSPAAPGFAIDSYNVHRLVIAGVTVASKFFSDVFYLNSRYAKVGGLPQSELNQLELQFLLLNDFRLMIPPEEMQRYANQLLLYSTTLHPPSPSLPLPPPIVMPTHSAYNETQALPTPSPSPSTVKFTSQPFTTQHALRHQASYDEMSSEGGYCTTDDEPTIRPDHSSEGSSIRTASSVTTSRATTPATSPTRRARWSTGSRRGPSSEAEQLHNGMTQTGEGDDDADTDGEGDETDDEDIYRRGRSSPSARIARRSRSHSSPSDPDTRMSSP